MPIGSDWPVPFVIDPQHLHVGAVTSFCISVLLAVMINAEAQAFAATLLGDARKNPKDRFHFNAFLHVDLLGAICYLVGGFGWPRTIDVDVSKFEHPRIYMVITRAAGPIANLLMASIGGSIAMIMNSFAWDPRVFLMVIGVNITTAVYSLLPLPPLAGGTLVYELIPPAWAQTRSLFLQAGPFLIIALALLERLTNQGWFSPFFNPIITAIFNFIRGS
jgi:Zn-dependent protease